MICRPTVGTLIIRTGFGGIYDTITVIRNPQDPILVSKAYITHMDPMRAQDKYSRVVVVFSARPDEA